MPENRNTFVSQTEHEHHELLVALVGQPNTGKSTVFNHLTGLSQTIANYPGVTVTKKSGHYHDGRRRIEVVDLPGTYSLTSYSQEERVTRDFLLLERPEVVVVVVDAANLRRHLYLVFQLLELQIPLLICLNMLDIARRRGIDIDIAALQTELGVPVVPTVGRKGEGFDLLRKKINDVAAENTHAPTGWKIDYGPLEEIVSEIESILARKEHLVEDFSPRWLAVKLLENDREARRIIQHHTHDDDWESVLDQGIQKLREYETKTGDSPRKTIAQKRNEKAEEIESRVVHRLKTPIRNSDRIDKIACHPIGGIFVIALVMFLTFELAFNIAQGWSWIPWFHGWTTPVGVCETIFDEWIPAVLDTWLRLEDGDLKSLINDGIVKGVGGVIVFVPVIFFIFLFLSILEQSGYVARIVVVLDRVMRRFQLHGQSVLPMILGGGIVGGCAVPAIMATRTMREPKERILTILVIPFMNCGAKIPVYALLISAFFFSYKSPVMVAIIFLSWAFALFSAWLLGKTIVRGTPTPLLIELPSYQLPDPKDVLKTACRQSWWFVKKAGTIILAVNVFLWVLMYYPTPKDPNADTKTRLSGSYAAQFGRVLVPVTQFAGFDWRDNVALVGGFAAKEVIVSSLSTIYGIEEDETKTEEPFVATTDVPSNLSPLQEIVTDELDDQGKRLAVKLRSEEGWSPLKAFALLVFVMLYSPCFPTCAVIWKETAAIKYMILAMVYSTVLAFVSAVTIYQVGRFLG